MLSLYKTLVRPHVEYCCCAWNSFYKDKELLEKIRHRYTKMIINTSGKTYEETLKSLGLWTLEEHWNRRDIIEVFKMYRGYSSVTLNELFVIDTNSKLNSTQRASMDAGVKTSQCPHLSSHFCISNTTINLICILICRRFRSGRP